MTDYPHEYINHDLGHSAQVCKYCHGTPSENILFGKQCDARKAIEDKPMSYETAISKIDELAKELDKSGFTSILCIKANGCRDSRYMMVTHPEHRPETPLGLAYEITEQITKNPPAGK